MSRTRSGVLWSAIERFSTQGVQFVISIILARLLQPADYGLIAIVNIFLLIFQTINETGFGAALMQKLDRDDLDFSSVFVFNIVLGFVLYLILFLFSPAVATFFHNEQLVLLLRMVGLNLIISSFVIIQRAKLYIKIDFKTQARASFSAALISGVFGVLCAYKGMGVMSLVAQSLIYNIINTAMIWVLVKWTPQFKFSCARFVILFRYAYKLTFARVISVVYNQVSVVFIGKFISTEQLGFYNRAYGFQQLPSTNIIGLVQRVSTPLLCEQQNDKAQMRETLKKFIVKTSVYVFPVMLGMIVLARPMVSFLLTDKWLPSVIMLQLLCPLGMITVLNNFNINIFNALGRTDLALRLEIIKKAISVALLLTAVKFGIIAILLTQVFVGFLELFFNTYYTHKFIDFGLLKQLKALSTILFSSVLMAVVVFGVTYFIYGALWKLIVGFAVGVAAYLLLTKLFKIDIL